YALYIGGIGVVVSAWMEWFASFFDSRIRGTVMGITWFASACMGTFGGLIAGWMISYYHHDAFFILYFSAGIVAVFSITCFAFVKDPAAEGEAEAKKIGIMIILAKFRESMRDLNFRSFLVGRIMASLGFCVIPFFAVYFQSESGGSLSGAAIVACGSATTFGAALANLILGRMGDRHGHRIGIIIGTVMQVATMLVIICGYGVISCVLAYFCTGICMGSSFLSHTNILLETCPHDHRIAHITVGNLALSLPMLFAPFVAGLAVESWGLNVVFTICLFINVMAVLWMLFMVKEPRCVEISRIAAS
ncbi:MAG: MFS transporter, partial [Rectinemataceae bacterium]|nr:MFS transporter [Rectinemataceae bacterium]